MRVMAVVALLASLLATVTTASGRADERMVPRFDYYVLSLSWSPAYCARQGDPDQRSPQCVAGAAPRGFVLHGLWPQKDDGRWPADCPAGEAVSEDSVRRVLPAMPDRRLIRHEWRRHGTCSGLSPDDYFARAADAFARVVVPVPLRRPEGDVAASLQVVKEWFIAVNPGLRPDGLALRCESDRHTVAEVRVCLDRDLSFRACGHGVADHCRADDVWFVPSR